MVAVIRKVGIEVDNRVETLVTKEAKVETKEVFYKMAIKNKLPKDIQAKAGI